MTARTATPAKSGDVVDRLAEAIKSWTRAQIRPVAEAQSEAEQRLQAVERQCAQLRAQVLELQTLVRSLRADPER